MESKTEISSYIENASIFALAILLFLLPVFMLTLTTDAFTLPKQIIVAGVALFVLVLFGIKSFQKGQIVIKRTPFDFPILLFTAVVFISSLLAVNKADAFISFVPFFLAVLAFFAITNTAREKNSTMLLATSLIAGAALVSTLEIFSFFKIYVLPFEFTKNQLFSPFGSLLDQALYLVMLLPLVFHLALPILKLGKRKENSEDSNENYSTKNKINSLPFAGAGIIVIIGILLSGYLLWVTPPQSGGFLTLPFDTGFQTGFAAMSQDTGRVFQGFAFGSGYGTYITDFTRFKQATFNQNADLWNLTFFRSSSYALELLATTGILGLLTFIFLLFKIFKNRFALSIMFVSGISAILLPFSFTLIALFFILLGIASAIRSSTSKAHGEGFSDVELQLVALQKGLITFDPTPSRHKNKVLPGISLIIIAILTIVIGYFSIRYIISDVIFQESLIAASQNNGSVTYEKQAKAIEMFKYRDAYYRIFSQTNLALANSLASQQPEGSEPNAEVQQTILTLIQQSINSARTSATYGPQTMLNWQNLASIYRSLIGFGQNADQFAILSSQQATALDPNNPQEYINLGGIYYQLGQWDNAIRQFQIAVALKPDLANAYYNLGHALQEKGDLANALTQYGTVQRLVASDKQNLEVITNEIEALKKTISGVTAQTPPPVEGEESLGVTGPDAQLPPQEPPVAIQPPVGSLSPTPTSNPSQQ